MAAVDALPAAVSFVSDLSSGDFPDAACATLAAIHVPPKLPLCKSFLLPEGCADRECPRAHVAFEARPTCFHFSAHGVCEGEDACSFPHAPAARSVAAACAIQSTIEFASRLVTACREQISAASVSLVARNALRRNCEVVVLLRCTPREVVALIEREPHCAIIVARIFILAGAVPKAPIPSGSVSPLDARTQLTPCNAFEPFIPQGGKLWGKTTVGVRCLGPSTWTIYVPVQVSVTGNYLVSARNLQAGNVLTTSEIVVRDGDLSTLPTNILTEPSQAIGKTIKNGIGAGQPLRSDQLIAPWAVQQNQSVKTVSSGPGFSVSSEGKALNNATEGQVVQVRTASGQTVSGIARAGNVVEVSR